MESTPATDYPLVQASRKGAAAATKLPDKSDNTQHFADSEIGTLQRIIIHAPDPGVGIFPPRAMRDLLYDDIVDYNKICSEYSEYLELLYWFLDPKKMRSIAKYLDDSVGLKPYFDPANELYLRSDKVIDVQDLLVQVCAEPSRARLVITSVAGLEGLSFQTQDLLAKLPPRQLASTLINGILPTKDGVKKLFSPATNFIFTRDTAVLIHDHVFITRPKERARIREGLLLQHALHQGILGGDHQHIVQLDRCVTDSFPDFKTKMTIEGGDIMMIAPGHVIIGFTSRTNHLAIDRFIRVLFDRDLATKVSVVCLPHARDFMHIDTVFTQIKRDLWAIFGPFSRQGHVRAKRAYLTHELDASVNERPVRIFQYQKTPRGVDCRSFDFLDDLLTAVSKEDMGHQGDVNFIYCGGGRSFAEEREQWMDGCNFLALAEGIVLGYDRNHLTTSAFAQRGFQIIDGPTLNRQLRSGESIDDLLAKDSIILLPSAELSRARGGSHCMSMPLVREALTF